MAPKAAVHSRVAHPNKRPPTAATPNIAAIRLHFRLLDQPHQSMAPSRSTLLPSATGREPTIASALKADLRETDDGLLETHHLDAFLRCRDQAVLLSSFIAVLWERRPIVRSHRKRRTPRLPRAPRHRYRARGPRASLLRTAGRSRLGAAFRPRREPCRARASAPC